MDNSFEAWLIGAPIAALFPAWLAYRKAYSALGYWFVGVFLWPIAVAAALFMRPNWPALVAREKRDAEERDAALREFEEREAKRAAVPDKPRPRYPGYS